jgi:hypothetical protein
MAIVHRTFRNVYEESAKLVRAAPSPSPAFGMLLEPLGDADRAFMMRSLPAPVGMLYPFLIDRPWKKYASTLRTGT